MSLDFFPSFDRDVYKWENWILHLIVRHYLFLQPINRKVFPLFQHSINWKRLACLFVSRSFCYWGYSLLALIQRLRNLKLRVRFFLKLLRRFESHIRFYAQSTGQKISQRDNMDCRFLLHGIAVRIGTESQGDCTIGNDIHNVWYVFYTIKKDKTTH